MKSRGTTFLVVAILLIVLIKVLHVNTSYCNSTVSTNVSSSWSSWNNSNASTESIRNPASSIPVVVIYKSKIIGDIKSPAPVRIDISDKNIGSLWVPLFKTSSFSFSVDCKSTPKLAEAQGVATVVEGKINISGKYSLIGWCSSEAADKLVVENIMNRIYDEAKTNIKSFSK
ncbi:hypothetical protein [Arcticibacter tournemirensis]|uniref:Uncharacterized protein n=1 Tax=Arcticibacter tournemirensis TaxID=699437 RepID=A0A4Q0MDN2_9SPHI|nr:hypothetical protein [Arcticibacter tournemirensis]RXF71345.1 hypothetical protein EKH83_06570 [Arcticibacter tournemirensis]